MQRRERSRICLFVKEALPSLERSIQEWNREQRLSPAPGKWTTRLTWTQRRRLNGALGADECNDGGNSAAVIEMGFSLKAMGDRRIA
jgi:hypothetical protein